MPEKPLRTGPRQSPEGLWGEDPKQLWKTVLDTVTDGLLLVDVHGRILSVNRALEQLTGYTREELVGRPCSILQCRTCPDSGLSNRTGECELFRQGRLRRRKGVIIRKEGTPQPVLRNAAVIKDNRGRVVAAVENFTDLSDTEARERVISRLRRQLSRDEPPGPPPMEFPEMMQQFMARLRQELDKDEGFHGIIGKSPVMMQLFTLMASAAQSRAPVLIYGEAGTGKELVAAAIHRLSPRPRGPFVRVHRAGLQESRLARELFGHVPRAGAEPSRVGGFEAADSGAIFLDEVGDLPATIQARLLRALREKVIEREGDPASIPVNVRLITATNRDLHRLMAAGRFRDDLYHGLGVIPLHLAPLRERREDIPLLIRIFVDRARRRRGTPLEGVSDEVLDRLRRHDWPGNVRELLQVIDYACGRCPGGALQPEHLPAAFQAPAARGGRAGRGRPGADERRRLIQAINQARGKKTEAARLLGISRVTLWKLLKLHGIQVEKTIRS